MKLIQRIKNYWSNRQETKKQLSLPSPEKETTQAPKILRGIALGSGGARGFAHLGVLKALEEEGIHFDVVTGTSAGSIVGALYAAGKSVDEIIAYSKTLSIKDIRGTKIMIKPSSTEKLEQTIRNFLAGTTFEDLRRKFALVAVDVNTGAEIILQTGDLPKSICASCAVPPFFKPVEIGDMRLIDGAYKNPIPSGVARDLGATKVLAIEVNSARGEGTSSTSIFEIWLAATRIAMKSTAKDGFEKADYILQPNLNSYKSTDTTNFDKIVEIGYNEAKKNMLEIKKALDID